MTSPEAHLKDAEEPLLSPAGLSVGWNWQTALKLLVCLGLIALVLSFVDWGGLISILRQARPSFLVAALAWAFIMQLLAVSRWWLLLRGLGLATSLGQSVNLHFIGLFFNTFLPSSIGGDAVKSFYLGRSKNRYSIALLSVMLDRYVGLLAILITVAVSASLGATRLKGVVFWPALVAAGGGLVVVGLLLHKGAIRWLRAKFPERWVRTREALSEVERSLGVLWSSPGILVGASCCSFLLIAGIVFLHSLIIKSLNLEVSSLSLFLFVPLIALASAIPFSLNGIGFRESSYLVLFSLVGFTSTESFSIALLVFATILLLALPGGLLFLLVRKPVSTSAPISNSSTLNGMRKLTYDSTRPFGTLRR